MRVCLFSNRSSGNAARFAAVRQVLAQRHRLTVLETQSAEDLITRIREAAEADRYDAIAIAGGDGTLHLAIQALAPRFPRTPLAFLPLGTGNDLCRTLGIPLDPLQAARLIRRGRSRRIDLIAVEGLSDTIVANAVTGGFSGQVANEVTSELKQAWGPLAYLRGAAKPVSDPTTYQVTLTLDDGQPQTHTILNLVIANGRTAGGGLQVAPTANPEDGLLDLVAVLAGDSFDHTVTAARLLAGDYQNDENVLYHRAKSVHIRSDRPMPISVDGELQELTEATFRILPRAIRVFPGPDYRPSGNGQSLAQMGWKYEFFRTIADILGQLRDLWRSPRGGGIVALLFALLFVLIAVTVHDPIWTIRNSDAAEWAARQQNPTTITLAQLTTRLGDPSITFTLIVVLMLVLMRWQRRIEAFYLFAGLIGVAATELAIKPYLAIPRPETAGQLEIALGYGFPSGHALRGGYLSMYLASMISWLTIRWWQRYSLAALVLAMGVSIALSRVILGVHSLADVSAGLTLGFAWAIAMRAALCHSLLARPGQ